MGVNSRGADQFMGLMGLVSLISKNLGSAPGSCKSTAWRIFRGVELRFASLATRRELTEDDARESGRRSCPPRSGKLSYRPL